jgi:acyl-CoA synthetase (AMP-forming)/AMP-acid ligase II
MLEGRNLWELVEARAQTSPDRRMLVDENGRALTFREYRDAAEQAAAGFAARGVQAGDVVSWQLPTWLESVVLVGALSRLGAVQNPILPIYREREVGYVIRASGAKLFIVPSVWRGFDFEAMARGLAEENGGMPEIITSDKQLPSGDVSALPPAPVPEDDPPVRWLFSTSGTTADPKIARHTDRTIMATARGMSERLDYQEDDDNGLAFPFTHIGGITWLFSSLLTGGGNILMEAFDPKETPEVFRREGVTIAGSGTPFHMAYVAAQRANPDRTLFPNLKNCTGGGAPKPPQLHYDVKEVLGGPGILSGYGLTEAPILTMSTASDGDDALANSEGKAMPGVELKLVTIEGKVCGIGEEGEVRAKAPQLMLGYLDESLHADAFDEEGYFRSGDLGVLDAEGNLKITGRLKDIIIRHGENISAKEVEDLLYTHPAVADVAVIGLPDPKTGERACAVIAPKEGAAPPSFVEMQEFLREKGLRNQAIPEQLEIVAAVPRNPAGKILKHELRAQYAPE